MDHIAAFTDLIGDQAAWLASHGVRVARVATTLGERLGLDVERLRLLHVAAHLHDVGKISVDGGVVNKPGPLTPREWQEMRRHPMEGFVLLDGLVHPDISEAVLCHHERYDGAGYPLGLTGSDIPHLSRILFVADAYDAMTNDRPYQSALGPEGALTELRAHAGTQFDPRVVAAMETLVGPREFVLVA
jgi:HD-GYP domain-containing protein (c-di-GMP phosphodiesterase class II)